MRRIGSFLVVAVLSGGCESDGARHPGSAPAIEAGDPLPVVDAAMPDRAGDVGSPADSAPSSDLVPRRDADAAEGRTAGACSDLFDQEELITYEVQIAPEEWDKLREEFLSFEARELAGLPLHPYHPMVLRYGAESLDAWIRLKGRSSWFNAVRKHGAAAKMQFVIAFDEGADSKRRFHGVQKVELDHAAYVDATWLHERLSTWYMRGAGLPAVCVNNARLVVNGAYYGLYSHLEHPDHDFLRRVFPGASDGDLWKKKDDFQWSKSGPDLTRHDRIWAIRDAAGMAALSDMTTTLRVWAAEAMLADADGYWGGNNNYLMYDHPSRGWTWLADDLDGTLDFRPADMHPLFFWIGYEGRNPGRHFVAVLSDPHWRARFIEALRWARSAWHSGQMQSLVDTWAEQIAAAAAADPHVPYSFADHEGKVARLRAFLPARAEAMSRWLECTAAGDLDADGDGAPWCLDCDEDDPASHLGAPEICGDGRDQSCNGVADDGCTR